MNLLLTFRSHENRTIDPIFHSIPDPEEPTSKIYLTRDNLSGYGACQLGDLRVSLFIDGIER